jgi:uncharacterized membrane protein
MAALHPEVVHFAIALLFVGVFFRVLSLAVAGRFPFVGPMAATLLILGTIAAVVAALTGEAAHGPVEAMPGLRPIVSEHERWGEWTRNIFIVVLIIEIVAVLLQWGGRIPRSTPVNASRWLRYAMIASAAVGVIGLVALYEAGEHGGEIVYSYAGGVGTRSGAPEDISRLFRAGLYQQGLADRQAGRSNEASRLFDQAAARFPDDVEVQLARAESILLDRQDASAAVSALQSISPPAGNRAVRVRHAMLTADALVASGQRDGAIAVLQQVLADGSNPRVQQKLDQLTGAAAPRPD